MVLVAGLAAIVPAQVHIPFTKKDQDFQTRQPSEVAETLRGGDSVKRSELATELEIMAPNDSNPAAKSGAVCADFTRVEEWQVALRADADNEVIVANSTQCDSTYIIVFDKARKGEWRFLQTMRLPSRVQRPDITFAHLVQPGISEIVVRRETIREGGAAEQENFVVLKLLQDRLVPVLDAVERLNLMLPNRPTDDGDVVTQTQQSTFLLVKSEANSGATMQILEKQVVKERKTSLTLYRNWDWDPALERFRAVASDGTEFVKASPPAKAPAKKTEANAQPSAGIPTPEPQR